MSPNVFTIPAGEPFLERLAQGLIGRHGAADLPELLILVPNRRSIQSLGDAFLSASGAGTCLLPRIRAVGDVDEDDLVLDPGPDFEDFEIPPSIGEIERQLLLARLILARDTETLNFASALQLASELARLIDETQIFKSDFARLDALAPERHAAHWQRIVQFLKLVSVHWPEILAARGEIDPAERRTRLIEALSARWQGAPPRHPVIIAGSTGSQPATANLMRIVAGLEFGSVILPGLDQWLDEPSWRQLDPGHPQFVLKQFLETAGWTRADVGLWPNCRAEAAPRAKLLSEALRPAAATDLWQSAKARLGPDLGVALRGLSLIEAPHEVEEAGAIALILREALEMPGRSACLITQDRGLARRVAVELARWRIEIDDSAGRPLGSTPLGTFIISALQAVADRLAPASLLALLKHELSVLPRERIAKFEIGALRGPRPAPGPGGLGATPFADEVLALLSPLETLAQGRHALDAWVRAHVAVLENFAAPEALWTGETGSAAVEILESLSAADRLLSDLTIADYAAIITDALNARAIRPAFGTHPRLAILGPIEARLHHADLVILGGLNEESWPSAPPPDPWFSRAMRKDFGLEPPERRIGQSAHDFAAAATADAVVMTRSLKSGGTPSVASRWLLRLNTLLMSLKGPSIADRRALDHAALLDRPDRIAAAPPPAPRPPVAARPKALWVTDIDRLIRDPYAVYARRVLNLKVLDPIDADPGAAERGIALHEILREFAERFPETLPVDVEAAFLEIARHQAAPLLARPGLAALWWPRIERIAAWFRQIEPELRRQGRVIGIEAVGAIEFDVAGESFRLSARADRIDARIGGLAILDYKTGRAPTVLEMKSELAVQLPLEGAIAARGGFGSVPAAPIMALEVLRLTGGYVPGEYLTYPDIDPGALAASAFEGVRKLLGDYADERTPYRSRPRVQLMSRVEDYDHLARVREWSAAGAET